MSIQNDLEIDHVLLSAWRLSEAAPLPMSAPVVPHESSIVSAFNE